MEKPCRTNKSKRSVIGALGAVALIAFSSSQALARPTEKEFSEAISQAKILDADCRVNIAIDAVQATLSTFLDKASKNEDNDCKINAVLLAKKLMDLDSDLVKVKVLFYDIDGVNYRQVLVKAGDVLALGSGGIEREKLLSSLEITKGSLSKTPASAPKPVDSSASAAPPAIATATVPTASSTTSPNTATAPTASKKPSAPTFSAAGVSFNYPQDWVPKRGADASVLAHFFSSTLPDTNYIDLDMFQVNRSLEGLADEKYRDWLYQPNYQIVYSGAIKLGTKGTIPGISRLITYQVENYPEYRYYQRHVFFGQPGRLYCLRYHAQYKDMQRVNSAFEHMLVTLQVQGLTGAKAPRAQGHSAPRSGGGRK